MSGRSIVDCHDVMAEVFAHLVPPSMSDMALKENSVARLHERTERCRTLMACSASAKSLSKHALDTLWRTLDDVTLLFRLLPLRESAESEWIPQGGITEAVWERFQTYATRVRHLRQCYTLPRLHPSVWSLLWSRCTKSAFLPCLQSLHALGVQPAQASSLLIFISPTVRDFAIEFEFDDEDEDEDDFTEDSATSGVANSFLHTLPILLSHLPRFKISGDNPMTNDTLSCISSFSGLQDISLGREYTLDEDRVRKLAGIRSLRSISFFIYFDESTNCTDLGMQGAFPEVSRACLAGKAKDLIRLFRSSSLSNLVDLDITIQSALGNDLTSSDSLAAVFQRIPKDIRRFKAVFEGRIALSFAAFIRPVLSLQAVMTIDISFYYGSPSISDDDLSLLAKSWPQIEQLTISSFRVRGPGRPSTVNPTASGIIDFARRCPTLRSLRLPELDGTVLPPMSNIPAMGHELIELSFQAVVLPAGRVDAALFALAALFDLPFPKLDTARSTIVEIPDSTAPSIRTAWARICVCIRAMQVGREHQKLYDPSHRASVLDRGPRL